MREHLTSIHSPFATLEAAFQQLTSPPAALPVDGQAIGHGLPGHTISLAVLRSLLLAPTTSYDSRDAAVAVLLRRAQTGTHADVIGLAGVLLPGLVRAAQPLLGARPDLRDDLELEILTSLVALIPTMCPDQDRLAARLIARATRAGYRLLRHDQTHRDHAELPETLVEPPTPPPHPDFVLDQAVAERVVSRDEAELIGQTRISGVCVREVAVSSAHSYERLGKRRLRAERRLVAWLLTRRLSRDRG